MATSLSASQISETKKQYVILLVGDYFVSGFFWVFSTLGSVKLGETQHTSIQPFFYSMIVLMISNGIWEILTGWYADKFRRRFSISVGFFVCLAGFLLMGMSAFFPGSGPRLGLWLTGVTVWSLGPALLSGAQEAWLVDRCNFLSANPPELLDSVFKTGTRFGVIAKACGSLICFLFLFLLLFNPADTSSEPNLRLAFSLAGVLAAFFCGLLGYYSLRIREEYWTDPKYLSEESLFSFLWMGVKDLWRSPYRWFTLAFIGATALNYTLSATAWPYLGNKPDIYLFNRPVNALKITVGIIIIELIAGYLSKWFSTRLDLIKPPALRMPIASLMWLIPVTPLYLGLFRVLQSDHFLPVLIGATFLFRMASASIFGALNSVGQLLIVSDERRATLLSMSSALASFFMAAAFIIIAGSVTTKEGDFGSGIQAFWLFISLPCVVMLGIGGWLVSRKVQD